MGHAAVYFGRVHVEPVIMTEYFLWKSVNHDFDTLFLWGLLSMSTIISLTQKLSPIYIYIHFAAILQIKILHKVI